MKRIVLIAAALAFSSMFAAGCADSSATIVSDDISAYEAEITKGSNKTLMKIDGDQIPLSYARVYILNYQNIYGRMYGADVMSNSAQAESFTDYVKDLSLTALAKTYTMSLLATYQGITLGADELSVISEAAAEYYSSLSEEEIEYLGVDEDDIGQLYKEYALAQKVYDKITESVNLEVSDDESRIMQAKQIFVTSEEDAKSVAKALKKGSDFDVVAAQYNEADTVDVTFGRGDMPDEVIQAAFELDDDEISGKIETDDGYYFIKCVNKFDESLSEERKTVIAKERKENAFNEVYDEFKASISSRIEASVWNSEALVSNEALQSDSFFEVFEKYL